MWDNFLIALVLITQVTGLAVPKILEEHWHLVPNYTEQNYFYWQAQQLPEIQKKDVGPKKVGSDKGPEQLAVISGLVIDAGTGQILWEKNAEAERAMASLTKLMTGLVFLEHQPAGGLEHLHTVTAQENNIISPNLNIASGTQVRTFDLLRAMLVGSDNNAAVALAHATEIKEVDFIRLMNAKAQALGMQHTQYHDVTGLSAENRTTAKDLAILLNTVIQYPELREPMGMAEHLMELSESKRILKVRSTDPLLLDKEINIIAGKTGYTEEAGYCLAVAAENAEGRRIIALVLGAETEAGRAETIKELVQWTFENYQWL